MKLTSDIKEGCSSTENQLASVVSMFKTFLEQYMSLELLRSKNAADLEHVHKNCLSTAETLKKVEEMFMFNRPESPKPKVEYNPFNPISSSTILGKPSISPEQKKPEDTQEQQKQELKMPPMPTFPSWPDAPEPVASPDAITVELQQYKRKIGEFAVSLATDLNNIQSQIWEQNIVIKKQLDETNQAMNDLRKKLNELFNAR